MEKSKSKFVLWFTGLSGSGKTTIGNELRKVLLNFGYEKIMVLDGDDLRNINKNKDYSKEGRIKNISTAISIMRFLSNKEYLCVVSIVAPYKFLRDELKDEFPFLEVYLFTSDIRGREEFFAEDYEIPTDPHALKLDTGDLTIEESVDKVLNRYNKMEKQPHHIN